MPSRITNGTSTTMKPSRFELPALDLNFGRITDGTNIPPPASPVQKVPTPPQTPTADKKGTAVDVPNGQDADKATTTPPNGNTAGSKRSVDDAPLSPAGSGRQGSLRRLFSRNMLSTTYADGRVMSVGGASMVNGGRPNSRGATSVADEKWSKRRSGWFRRLRGADTKRSSIYFEEAAPVAPPPKKSLEPTLRPCESPQKPQAPQKPAGPPPPMIPELGDLESDAGSLGSDLFKNIK